MPRNMSFSMTTSAVKDRTKDVTRRNGWENLKPGELFWAVQKAMGLKPGEKIVRLSLCRCVSNDTEPLQALLDDLDYGFREVQREGMAGSPVNGFPSAFCDRFIAHMGGDRATPRQRIAFSYVTDPVTIRLAKKPRGRKRKAVAHA